MTKGQKLAALSATDFQNKVIAAEADLATAEATLTRVAGQEERDRILADKGYTPRSVYDKSLKSLRSAEAAVQAAEANLRIAQNQLGYTQLLAPNDGVVTATGADPGQVVEAGQMVVEISRDAEREAVFAVAGADVARATPRHAGQGMAAGSARSGGHRLRPRDLAGGRQHHGHLRGEGRAAFGAARRCASAPSWSAAPKPRARKSRACPPPRSCNPGTVPQVWVVSEDNQVHRRAVELLEFDMESVVVGAGLAPGEMVVTAGVNSLADGQDVKPETELQ